LCLVLQLQVLVMELVGNMVENSAKAWIESSHPWPILFGSFVSEMLMFIRGMEYRG
tara:strand:+ start:280 stop:447 length:168 start_codon:yes stop_codon:yes gene_type:complete